MFITVQHCLMRVLSENYFIKGTLSQYFRPLLTNFNCALFYNRSKRFCELFLFCKDIPCPRSRDTVPLISPKYDEFNLLELLGYLNPLPRYTVSYIYIFISTVHDCVKSSNYFSCSTICGIWYIPFKKNFPFLSSGKLQIKDSSSRILAMLNFCFLFRMEAKRETKTIWPSFATSLSSLSIPFRF